MGRRPSPRSPEALKKRILSVSEDTHPLWGDMSIEQCLDHLCETFEIAFGTRELRAPKSFFLRHPLTKWLVIESPFPWFRGIPTPTNFPTDPPKDLERVKLRLIENLEKSNLQNVDFAAEHPVMGKLSREQWQKYLWRHLDFHLGQFSV